MTDGQDGYIDTIHLRVKSLLDARIDAAGPLIIHTFGYGEDNDSRILTYISGETMGKYYNIENNII